VLHLQRQQHRLEQYEVRICQQGRVSVAGRWHQLSWHRGTNSGVQQWPDRLTLSLSPRIRRDEQTAVRDLLQRWFRNQASERLVVRCRQLAEATGLHPAEISIGSWRARWGQCSSRGEVGLNWRLLQLEPALQDYVILHELCHLQQMNHGPRFHALLLTHCPAHPRYRAELARYGSWLNW
jgi:predicted metal-dependent hydrolase